MLDTRNASTLAIVFLRHMWKKIFRFLYTRGSEFSIHPVRPSSDGRVIIALNEAFIGDGVRLRIVIKGDGYTHAPRQDITITVRSAMGDERAISVMDKVNLPVAPNGKNLFFHSALSH